MLWLFLSVFHVPNFHKTEKNPEYIFGNHKQMVGTVHTKIHCEFMHWLSYQSYMHTYSSSMRQNLQIIVKNPSEINDVD